MGVLCINRSKLMGACLALEQEDGVFREFHVLFGTGLQGSFVPGIDSRYPRSGQVHCRFISCTRSRMVDSAPCLGT